MKLRPYFSTGLAVGGFLLAGTTMHAQNAGGTKGAHPMKTTSVRSSGPAGLAVDHAGGNGVRRADHPSTGSGAQAGLAVDHAGGSLEGQRRESRAAHQPSRGSGTQAGLAVDHAGGNGVRRANRGSRKHLGNVKYSDRTSTGTHTPNY